MCGLPVFVPAQRADLLDTVWELKGFQRVTLVAGESRTMVFTLGTDELRYWHALQRDWVIDTSTFDVWVGGDSNAGWS